MTKDESKKKKETHVQLIQVRGRFPFVCDTLPRAFEAIYKLGVNGNALSVLHNLERSNDEILIYQGETRLAAKRSLELPFEHANIEDFGRLLVELLNRIFSPFLITESHFRTSITVSRSCGAGTRDRSWFLINMVLVLPQGASDKVSRIPSSS